MLSFDNTHIFTGYLKQLLSSVNLPTCKIYTKDFYDYKNRTGEEDPRVLESIDTIVEPLINQDKVIKYKLVRLANKTNYLKNNELYNYFYDYANNRTFWKHASNNYHYDVTKKVPGLTKTLKSAGLYYDLTTHEYLGEYLRFLRDYYNMNLMSMYNCFTNKIYNNIDFEFNTADTETDHNCVVKVTSQDPNYKIYALPVKLFSKYTIAVDSSRGIELFCGFYKTTLDTSEEAKNLAKRTYQKENCTLFKQPILYDKLDVGHWPRETNLLKSDKISRLDIANREQDLKLFIKIPNTCRSSIVVLEGDFRHFNDFKYVPDKDKSSIKQEIWTYESNRSVLNFNTKKINPNFEVNTGDGIDLNEASFIPISKLQLLAFNTGESYPFADRLIEYLSGSTITPIDEIYDNVERVQAVMNKNGHFFKINGLWENKIQKIAYDYMLNSGPIEIDKNTEIIVDKSNESNRTVGIHPTLGYSTKSSLYDILGFIDKDVEKYYASWKKENGKPVASSTIQNIDIYKGLYDV